MWEEGIFLLDEELETAALARPISSAGRVERFSITRFLRDELGLEDPYAGLVTVKEGGRKDKTQYHRFRDALRDDGTRGQLIQLLTTYPQLKTHKVVQAAAVAGRFVIAQLITYLRELPELVTEKNVICLLMNSKQMITIIDFIRKGLLQVDLLQNADSARMLSEIVSGPSSSYLLSRRIISLSDCESLYNSSLLCILNNMRIREALERRLILIPELINEYHELFKQVMTRLDLPAAAQSEHHQEVLHKQAKLQALRLLSEYVKSIMGARREYHGVIREIGSRKGVERTPSFWLEQRKLREKQRNVETALQHCSVDPNELWAYAHNQTPRLIGQSPEPTEFGLKEGDLPSIHYTSPISFRLLNNSLECLNYLKEALERVTVLEKSLEGAESSSESVKVAEGVEEHLAHAMRLSKTVVRGTPLNEALLSEAQLLTLSLKCEQPASESLEHATALKRSLECAITRGEINRDEFEESARDETLLASMPPRLGSS